MRTPRPAAAPGVYLREMAAEIVRAARMPQFLLPTILLPPAFYALFALGIGRGDADTAAYTLATFGVFAILGPALFGFGANVAAEREAGQLELRRLSPAPAGAHIAGKLAATLVYSAVAIAAIYGLATFAGVALTPMQWAALAGVHALGALPFAMIGLGIGYRMGQKGAIAVVNIVFLAFAVIGGLWFPITILPGFVQQMAWAMPSYHLGELALIAVGQRDGAGLWLHAGPLALLTAAAALFAWTGQQRPAA